MTLSLLLLAPARAAVRSQMSLHNKGIDVVCLEAGRRMEVGEFRNDESFHVVQD